MKDFLAYTVLGVCLGSIYAIAASGLVVTYATSGIFNFAHGAVGMISAVFYWQCRVAWHMPAPVAIVLTVFVFAPAIGAVIELVVMRGLHGTSEITRLVVPVAVLLGINGAATWIWFRHAKSPYIITQFFGPKTVKIFGQAVSYHQLIGVGLSGAIAVGLWLLLYRTRIGVTMRATVDDATLLTLNGGRPARASLTSWAVGSMLGGLAGVLLAPQLGSLEVLALTLLVINAYPAAMFGRLRSVPLAYLGAMGLGLVQEYWDWISKAGSRFGHWSNLRIALPALMLGVVLLVLPQDRLRGAVVLRTRERFNVPTVKQAVAWGVVLVVGMAMLQSLMVDSAVISLANAMGLALMALSLVLLTGYAGEINLAVYTFAGIALVIAWQFDVGPHGLATRTSMSVLGILLAMLVCAILGGLTALPAVRLKGLYLGLATFSMGIVVTQMVLSQSEPLHVHIGPLKFVVNLYTNSTFTVPRPHWFGIDFVNSQRNYLMLLTVLFALIGIFLIVLRRSAFGRMITAMKESPAACATLGLNIRRLKLAVFMLSSALAGLGGLMWTAQVRTVSNNGTFDVFQSLALFMLAVVGGIGYVSGALLAGIFLAVLSVIMPNILTKLGTDYPSLHWLFVSIIGNFTKFVGPAMVGIGLGRNPTGIAQSFIVGFRPLRKAPGAVAVWAAVQVGLWALAFSDAIGNWPFAVLTILNVVLGPRVIMAVFPDRFIEDAVELYGEDPDLIGVERPFTSFDRDHFDLQLGLPDAGTARE